MLTDEAQVRVCNGLVDRIPAIIMWPAFAGAAMFGAQVCIHAIGLQRVGKLVDCARRNKASRHFVFDQTLAARCFCGDHGQPAGHWFKRHVAKCFRDRWVEKYIHDYEGSVVVVSHDRYFLDRTVDNIAEVSNAKITLYPGNFSFYEEEKALRNEIQKGAYENQQSQIRQTERFIERFKAKASKARQVQSRVKALDKIDIIDDVIDEKAKVNFKFNFGTEPGRFILFLEHISKAFGEKVILKNTSATLNRGDKIALIGANGKGKSTLLRIISGTEQIDGERRTGHNVIESFFAQHQLESLTVENTLIEELKGTGTTKTEMELRSVLGCFLFSGEEVFKKIKVLSGGEKSRVALAKVLISEANFLLLDEPTNHLDMQSVNILIQALQQYEGTYVVVSHDRYFVTNIANKIWYIEDHEIKEYPGTFDEYETWMATRETAKPAAVKSQGKPKPELAPVEAKTPNQAKQIEKLEAEIMEIENRIAALETQMVDLANTIIPQYK